MEPFLALESKGGAKENNLQSQLMLLSYNCTRRRIGSLVLVSLGVTLMSRDDAKVSIAETEHSCHGGAV